MAAKQTTVSMRQIGAGLADKQGMSKKQTNEVLEAFIGAITKSIRKGDKVRLPGLGIFQVRHRKARMGRNPATGEAIKIKASKKVAFRASKDLKESV